MPKDSWNPNQYNKFKTERSQPFFDLMNMLDPVKDIRVADLGCGTGDLTLELHRYLQARQSTGFDSSEQMLEKAKAFEGDGLSFVKGDIATWRHEKTFDVIFSNAAIQWVTDHPQVIENLRDSLVTGGQLAIQMPINQDYPTHTIAYEMSRSSEWKKLLGDAGDSKSMMLRAEDYASLLFKLGFGEQRVLVRVYGHRLDSREDVIEWVKGTLLTRFESSLSPNDYLRFIGEFKERLFAVLPDEKPFFYPFKRLLMWARL